LQLTVRSFRFSNVFGVAADVAEFARIRGRTVFPRATELWSLDESMNIRRATPDDAPLLARAQVEAWHKAYRGIVPDAYLQSFSIKRRTECFRQSLATNSEETYVAEVANQVVGFLTLGKCRDSDVDPKTTGEIWGIYLSPEHWRKGVGRFLSEQGETMLASRGFSVATLWVLEANDQARRFYEAVGFEPDGATKEVKLGAPLTAIRYRKKLEIAEQLHAADAVARAAHAGR